MGQGHAYSAKRVRSGSRPTGWGGRLPEENQDAVSRRGMKAGQEEKNSSPHQGPRWNVPTGVLQRWRV